MEEGERRAYKCLRAKEEGLTTAFQSLSSASSVSAPDLNEAIGELHSHRIKPSYRRDLTSSSNSKGPSKTSIVVRTVINLIAPSFIQIRS